MDKTKDNRIDLHFSVISQSDNWKDKIREESKIKKKIARILHHLDYKFVIFDSSCVLSGKGEE